MITDKKIENQTIIYKFAKGMATLFLGVVIPLILMFQAYFVLHELSHNIQTHESNNTVTENFIKVRKELSSANDFLLFTKLQTENVNYNVMINKQVMKVAVMNIGFAVMSVGIMFILLGFKEISDTQQKTENGMTLSGAANGIKFDVKTGSTGLAIFILGSLMASGSGILPNEYRAGDIPGYWYEGKSAAQRNIAEKHSLSEREELSVRNYQDCRINNSDGLQFARCFTNRFADTYDKETSK
ncbi:hypothetical protein ACO0LC_15710 [Undibacterium sp. JH2W]|uniref:hypothetical protein n=1 Tax=Undibacterium sp. JH2W TaxID=3413037 RepID=UPI003BF34DEC